MHVMAQLQQELVEKEATLVRLQAVVQEHREAGPPSIATAIETTLVKSPFVDIYIE